MAANSGYNSTTAARIRCSDYILNTPATLALFQEKGGLVDDLQAMIDRGRLAATHDLAQSVAGATAKGSTIEVIEAYRKLGEEYAAIMGATQAARLDAVKSGASPTTIAKVDKILANEAELNVTTIDQDGEKKRKTSASQSQEAIRYEIEKDAGAMLELTEAQEIFARRNITPERLEALRASAKALSGKLTDRIGKKNARKVTTQEERDAVKQQSEIWAACYRILTAVGARDPNVQEMLKEASRRRS